MPTSKPRISTVVERPVYEAVRLLAHRDGVSVSDRARALLLDALELEEDVALESLVKARMAKPGKTRSLAEVKRKLGLR